jgi:hypothetical protein
MRGLPAVNVFPGLYSNHGWQDLSWGCASKVQVVALTQTCLLNDLSLGSFPFAFFDIGSHIKGLHQRGIEVEHLVGINVSCIHPFQILQLSLTGTTVLIDTMVWRSFTIQLLQCLKSCIGAGARMLSSRIKLFRIQGDIKSNYIILLFFHCKI